MGGLLMEGTDNSGCPNYKQIFSSDEKSFCFGSTHQPSMGERTGEKYLSEPPQENFSEAADDESDEDVDIEELEGRMWRDRMRLKRLKERQQNKHKEQVDSAKQHQTQEQARRKTMSRAQDGILKYMLKMMEVCNAQGFVYGIIPEKGKPVSGASDNFRGWWKEKACYPPSSGGGNTGAISLGSSCIEYDVEGVDDGESMDMVNDKSHSEVTAFDPSSTAKNVKTVITASMKEETKMDFIQKRGAAEPELMQNQRIYTCGNVQCPHSDFQHGFLDRNARNSHQYLCKYQNTIPEGIRTAISGPKMKENKPQIFSLPFNTQLDPTSLGSGLNSGDISDVGVPFDGQKSINELMSFYDNNVNANRNLNMGGIGMSKMTNSVQPRSQMEDFFFAQGTRLGGNVFEQADNLVQQQQFLFHEDIMPFEQQFGHQPNELSGDFSFGPSFNMHSMNYSDTSQRETGDPLQKPEASNWFY
ncbi:hypothetical protein BHE74_00013852 [Ensete ventricosum]|nr:hypothetical protein BHE74_00013852 [Ensete ventricosum]